MNFRDKYSIMEEFEMVFDYSWQILSQHADRNSYGDWYFYIHMFCITANNLAGTFIISKSPISCKNKVIPRTSLNDGSRAPNPKETIQSIMGSYSEAAKHDNGSKEK